MSEKETALRQELKEQIEENKKLEKKVDGLVTVIDLVKEYIGGLIYQNEVTDEILEILERVNEE